MDHPVRWPDHPGLPVRDHCGRGTIVSYVPNNALLVRASSDIADRLAVAPDTAAMLPLEPYFKLTPRLLDHALRGEPLPEGQQLMLTIPEASRELPELTAMGIREVARQRGPFGTLVLVEAPADSLVAVAALPMVHRVEPRRSVRLANDVTAFALGSTTVPENTDSFDGLDGNEVLVNVNDSGVDASQPDLMDRVYTIPNEPQILTDPSGHGTHVAGIIAGSGAQSGTINQPPDGPPSGSLTNANFKGKAPRASLFVLPVDLLFGPASGDAYLQETAAQAPERFNTREDVLISNNSWGYAGFDEYEYSTHSASYDAAVRDALPWSPATSRSSTSSPRATMALAGTTVPAGLPTPSFRPATARMWSRWAPWKVPARSPTPSCTTRMRSPCRSGVGDPAGLADQSRAVLHESGVAAPQRYRLAGRLYSSRGNVGIGIEGPNGRYKPDVVAPGSFIISTRSLQWTPEPLPP